MAERLTSTAAVRGWKTLPIDELDRKLRCLGLMLDREAKVIICIECEYALKPSDAVSIHLADRHKTTAKARHGLNAFVKQLQLPNLSGLQPRPDGSSPHQYLAKKPGVACRLCDYRSTSIELVRRHLSKEHGEKGDRRTWLRTQICEDLLLQSWTQTGTAYWIVKDSKEGSLEASLLTSSCSPKRMQTVTALHERERRRIDVGQADVPIVKEDIALMSNWIRRTGWLETFADVDRQLLSRLSSAPAKEGFPLSLADYGKNHITSSVEDEMRLAILGNAVDRFFKRCEDTAINTDHSMRCWLRSHVNGRPYKAAFQLPGRRSTRKRYVWLWKSMLYFIFRLWRLDDVVRNRTLGLRFSAKQCQAIEEIWTALPPRETATDVSKSTDDTQYGSKRHSVLQGWIEEGDNETTREHEHNESVSRKPVDESVPFLGAKNSRGLMASKTRVRSNSIENMSSDSDESFVELGEDSEDEDGFVSSLHQPKPCKNSFLKSCFIADRHVTSSHTPTIWH